MDRFLRPLPRVVLFALILTQMPAHAQIFGSDDKGDQRAQKLYEQSGKHLSWDRFEEAIKALEEAVDIAPSLTKAHNRLGQVHLTQQNFGKAINSFSRVLELDSSFSKFTQFRLGKAYFYAMKYDSAELHLREFLNKPNLPEEEREKAEQQLANITFAEKAVANPVPFDPQNIGKKVNSERPDFSPALTADEKTLIFTRLIQGRGRKHEDFYVAKKHGNEWSKAYNLGVPVNTPKNQGAHTITPDGRYLIFTGCQYRDSRGSCDLYITSRRQGRYSEPQNLGRPVNTGAWESQPSIAPDASTLYFASNRNEDSYGGSDIWKTNYLGDGEWSEPENLGPRVNTPKDERAPFIHSDNETLYFSSNGHKGMGEHDLYVTRKKTDTTWTEPRNLGYPINTPTNDNWLFVSADGEKAYFSSDREDTYGDMDIYSFNLYEEAQPREVTYVKGTVYDKKTDEKLPANILIKDLETGETLNSLQTQSKTGGFLVTLPVGHDYACIASKKGYMFHSEHFSLTDTSIEKPFQLDIPLQPIEVGSDMVLRNIFFELDSHELRDESKVELDRLVTFLKNHPALTIEIGGHTDSIGTDTYNEELSRKRAEAVYTYLRKHDIPKDRLTYKGYGETDPVETNTTPEGRAGNRRTEVTVIEKGD